jgi:hypothetical protein
MITITHQGNFEKTTSFLARLPNAPFKRILTQYGERGLVILRQNTPVDSGVTADSWGYEIQVKRGSMSLVWTNSHVTPEGVPIVILIQYGHGTKGGAYIQGIDFINPIMVPLFEKLSGDLWEEVTKL